MKRTLAAVVASALLLIGCTSSPTSDRSTAGFSASAVDLEQSDSRAPRSAVARMVRRLLPSVVNVRVTSVDPFGSTRRGQGSGVIIDADGFILTNAHVIRGAREVTVVLNDGTELDGEVVGVAEERDLAVVKVGANELRPVEIGRSSPPHLNLGDSVVAIGFPLGLGGPTVTKGIVSGQDRNINVGDGVTSFGRLEGLLQTDAAINPGNSGGPLVNLAGQLVGINSAGASASAAENIGFAIAVDDALPVVEEIIAEPDEERAWMGVSVETLTPVLAAQLGLSSDTGGALVRAVVASSPAEDAGIQPLEVIVRVGATDIESAPDLTTALAELAPGDSVEVELVSGDGTRTVDLELAPRPPTL
jgi:serine protease Do